MKSENILIARNTLFLYIRTVIVLLVSLYTSRVVLQSLGVTDFGIYNVVGSLVTMFCFINGAMSAATLRFLTFELGRKDNDQLSVVFSTSLIIHAVISLFVVLLAETVGLWFLYNKMVIPEERMLAASVVYQISVLTSVVTIMNVPYNSLLIAHEKMSSFAYITILDATLKLAVAISISFFLYDKLILYSILLFAVYVTVIMVYFFYCHSIFPESHFRMVNNKTLIGKMSKFAAWNLFSNLAYVTYTQGVNVLLNMFFGPVVNAARGIAVMVQAAVSKFVDSFQSALNPQITKSYASNDRERLLFLIDTSSRYSFYLILILIFPLFVSIDYILFIWLGNVPAHTANFIRITFLTMPISVLMNSLNIATQATGRVKRFFIITGSLQLLILPLSYITLKIGGSPEAVYLVTLAYTFSISFIYIRVTCSEIHLSMWLFIKKVSIRAYIVALCASILPLIWQYNIPPSMDFGSAVLNMTIAEVSVLCSIIILGMKATERKMFCKTIKNKLSI